MADPIEEAWSNWAGIDRTHRTAELAFRAGYRAGQAASEREAGTRLHAYESSAADGIACAQWVRDHWLGRLPQGERVVLEILIAAHTEYVSREDISERTGYKRSSRDTYIQKLRARRLLADAERGGVKASDELF